MKVSFKLYMLRYINDPVEDGKRNVSYLVCFEIIGKKCLIRRQSKKRKADHLIIFSKHLASPVMVLIPNYKCKMAF